MGTAVEEEGMDAEVAKDNGVVDPACIDAAHKNGMEGTYQNEEGNLPLEEGLVDDNLQGIEHGPPTPHQILEDSACTPLFEGAGLTQLGGTLLLLNCLRTHGASNQLMNEVFAILSKSMLSKVNSLPCNEYQASKVLSSSD